MTDQIWPVDLIPNDVEWRLIDNVVVSASPFSGATRRVARPGTRWGARLSFTNMRAAKRHRILALLAAMRGRANSIWIPDVSTKQRGVAVAPERFSNPGFGSVTGWSVQGGTLSARNGVMRATSTGPSTLLESFQTPSVVQFAPYALRSLFQVGAGFGSLSAGPALSDGVGQDQLYTASRGLITVSRVCLSGSSTQYPFVINASSDYIAGAFVDHLYASSARCLQVDNGVNAALYSDQLDNAAWAKSELTVTANADVAPDGTSTADRFVETTATAARYIVQSPIARASAAADLCTFGYFKQTGLTRDIRLVSGNDNASNYSACVFNLAAGTAGAVSNNGTATNGRAFIRSAGNGWYFCALISSAVAAATMVAEFDFNNAGSGSYAGSTSASISAWRLGCAVSASPTRGAQTAAVALSSGALQTGSSLYIKGGPASTAGLYAAGDMVEILLSSPSELTKSQMVRLTADLDTDATGCGVMQFEPSLRSSPADNAPIIGTKPLCKMMMSGSEQAWPTRPGLFSDFTIDLVEDIAS